MKKLLGFAVLSLGILSLCSCETQDSEIESNNTDQFDQLGGNEVGDVSAKTVLTASDYSYYEISKPVISEENIVDVNLQNPEAEGITFVDNLLTITNGGTYRLYGNLKGAVSVDSVEEDVTIILDNANITTLDSQSCAALVFKKNSRNRTLYLNPDSYNSLSDSAGDTEAEGDSAVIQAKKSSLNVCGSGTLDLKCLGEDSTGIKVKKELAIYDSTIKISAYNNGIKADEAVFINNADININAENDGIKTDIEPESLLEAEEYASNEYAGYISIINSNINITCNDDGISANSGMYINNAGHEITIKTNGGAPTSITESSSDNADGKGIKVGGITYTDASLNETDITSKLDKNYILIIAGGNFTIDSNDDAISSKGNMIILNGEFSIKSGDDGIHSEYITQIENGNIDIIKCYEGIEGAIVSISGGKISIISTDDGINAANGDLKNYSFYIYISGGNILVDASGDGIDSNGSIEISGGNVVVYGPTFSNNAALDADKGVIVTGGNVIAFGSSGMVESPASNSTQAFITVNLSKNSSSKFTISDNEGNEIYSIIPKKNYQSIIVSLTEFVNGNTYNIQAGNESYSITLSGISNIAGNSFNNQGDMRPVPGKR